MLAVYQKSNVIELESKSESSPTEDPEYTALPKMLASAETKQRHILAIDKQMVLYRLFYWLYANLGGIYIRANNK